jgi:hypothetical protein
MATADATQKICVHCKQDCSGKPRAKDAQGRYMCKECVEKLKARGAAAPTRPASPPAPPTAPPATEDDHSVLSTLLGDLPEPCPSCAAPLTTGAVVCNFCGFNKETGQGTRTRVMAAPREKRAKLASGPSLSISPTALFWVYLGIQVAPVGLSAAAPGVAIVGYGIASLCYVALVIATVVVAFMMSPAPGIMLIATALAPWVALFGMQSILLFLFLALVQGVFWLYFIFAQCESSHVRAAWAAQILVIVTAVLVGMFGAFSALSELNH